MTKREKRNVKKWEKNKSRKGQRLLEEAEDRIKRTEEEKKKKDEEDRLGGGMGLRNGMNSDEESSTYIPVKKVIRKPDMGECIRKRLYWDDLFKPKQGPIKLFSWQKDEPKDK